MDLLLEAFREFFILENLILIPLALIAGQILGAIPGMSSIMAIAIVIPFTYGLSPVTAVTLLMSFYKGGLSGGSIASILIGTPGTAAAAATTLDGYPLAKEGKAGKALETAQIASALGSLFSDVLLITIIGFMAQIALNMTSPELLLIVVFAMLTVGSFTAGNPIKGYASALLGIFFSMLGPDPTTGLPRYSFGVLELEAKLDLVPVLLGVLALSEIFYEVYFKKMQSKEGHLPIPKNKSDARMTWQDFKDTGPTTFQSSVIGAFIGMMPGLGPTIGAFLSHSAAKRTAKDPEKLGKGSLSGVAAAEAGNNAVAGANLVPLFSFGIPGDAEAALVLSALMLHGLTVGPQLFVSDGPLVYGIFISLIVADIVLIFLGLYMVRYFAKPLTKISTRYLYPTIIILMLAGTFGVTRSMFGLVILVVFGVIGLIMKLNGFSVPAFIIGFVLGSPLEGWLQRSYVMVKNDSSVLLRPSFIITALILIGIAIFMKKVSKKSVPE
ncbi:tripartite tricarboxylate transporter permease [Ureibacillus composti]